MFTGKKIALLLFFSFILAFAAASQKKDDKQFTVVLDAGHGGHDPGTVGTKRYKEAEKHHVLDITLRAGKLISDNIANTRIVYTRDKDVFVTLQGRSKIANNAHADIFISVHCDAIDPPVSNQQRVRGASCYVMGLSKTAANSAVMRENAVIDFEDDKTVYKKFDQSDPSNLIGLRLLANANMGQSIELAKLLQGNVESTGRMRKALGVMQGVIYVTCYNTMPSALMELGYLTNREDEDYIRSEEGKEALAKSLFQAVAEYKRKFFDNRIKSEEDAAAAPQDKPAATAAVKEQPAGKQSAINYRVQLFSSASPQSPAAHPILKQFEGVEVYRENNMYKFTAGREATHEDARSTLSKAFRVGAKDAFIVAFDGETKISIQEARERNGGK